MSGRRRRCAGCRAARAYRARQLRERVWEVGLDLARAALSPAIHELSGALAALGAYAEEPTAQRLAIAEHNEGTAELSARLANALYGTAWARVLHTEVAAHDAGVDNRYRAEAWQAAGADAEGVAILLHYTAMCHASELAAIQQRLPVDLGVISAASSGRRSGDTATGDHDRAQHRRSPRRARHPEPGPDGRPTGNGGRPAARTGRRRPGRGHDHQPRPLVPPGQQRRNDLRASPLARSASVGFGAGALGR
ncbi:hypothetical protein FHX42_005215 [Saccharopolyspora lacisalsi]|uniref:Uncharacterized protein n=1 Tax=Halosaccharopolyspora lacisalsi TaxID=1000566 RepID=A0A839EAD7_9PSEU|nr:hypothetical protein [Halosaccharopolyspora lacisalsi]MBA8827808.1 hypothetical protein [Halosaccharopolyspora lacisalsi]